MHVTKMNEPICCRNDFHYLREGRTEDQSGTVAVSLVRGTRGFKEVV